MNERQSSVYEAIHWLYESYQRAKLFHQNQFVQFHGASPMPDVFARLDSEIRHPEWTEVLLNEFGRPERSAYNVAVTGSKGKGSHAVLIAGILQKLGLRVGLFTGPHLIDFMERFRVDGQVMPEAQFVSYVHRVRNKTAGLNLSAGEYVGPVGLLAVVAALWFRDSNTDVNVFELGRGALHDDVNRVWHQGAVVTPVFLEHSLQLGPTLDDVAREKAGVVTDETRWVWSGPQSPEVIAQLQQRAETVGAQLNWVGEQACVTTTSYSEGPVQVLQVQEGSEQVSIRVSQAFLSSNVFTSVAAARAVWRDLGARIPWPEELDLTDLVIPGRLQVVRREPLTLVDGTIHRSSATYIKHWLEVQLAAIANESTQTRDPVRPLVAVVLGLPADKDGVGVLESLQGIVDWLGFARAHNPYLRFDDTWISLAKDRFNTVTEFDFAEQAIVAAEQQVGNRGIILILGTQSFVADALAWLQVDTKAIWKGM
ncbi:bifunctional folylpolyglutamate synthase/dihydrofolate synthase [Alicyclobacillaceae bacterium I2511]|nr:bifunctional folylpolyglutamate synthase/dihydrofolate synthase [Alicyclobacillaceae bacterium I2511]